MRRLRLREAHLWANVTQLVKIEFRYDGYQKCLQLPALASPLSCPSASSPSKSWSLSQRLLEFRLVLQLTLTQRLWAVWVSLGLKGCWSFHPYPLGGTLRADWPLKDGKPCGTKGNHPKQRPLRQGLSSQTYGFSSSHVWMWELDYKESWAPENWCFWTVVLEKTRESLGLQGDPTSPS